MADHIPLPEHFSNPNGSQEISQTVSEDLNFHFDENDLLPESYSSGNESDTFGDIVEPQESQYKAKRRICEQRLMNTEAERHRVSVLALSVEDANLFPYLFLFFPTNLAISVLICS